MLGLDIMVEFLNVVIHLDHVFFKSKKACSDVVGSGPCMQCCNSNQ